MKTLDQLTNIPQQERRAAQLGGLAVRGERERVRRQEVKFREVLHVLAGLAGLAIALALIGGLVYAAVAVDPHSGKMAREGR